MTVYFIGAGRVVKIGYTAGDPMVRLADLQVGNHRKLKLLAVIPGELADEQRLHKRFDRDRITGEWFTYSRRIRTLVRSVRGWNLDEPTEDEVAEVQPAPVEWPLILERVREAWPAGSDRARTSDLVTTLAARWDEYADWKAADLTRALAAAGVRTRPLWIDNRTARGVLLADVAAVAGVVDAA